MTEEKPYCTCNRGRNEGFTEGPDGFWVHSTCRKPTKFVYDKIALPKLLAGGKKYDEIMRRREIFEHRVQERIAREIEMIAKDLDLAVSVVGLIWDKF